MRKIKIKLYVSLLIFHIFFIKPIVVGQNLVADFQNGKTKICKSDGSGKCLGLKFQFKYPKTWREIEGERLHISKKIVNDSTAEVQIILVLKKLEQIVTKKETSIMLSENAIKSGLINNHSTTIDKITTNQKIDGINTSIAVYTSVVSRLDSKIKFKTITYFFYYKDYQLMLTCSVNSLTKDVNVIYSRYEMLFKLIANSFILTSQYE